MLWLFLHFLLLNKVAHTLLQQYIYFLFSVKKQLEYPLGKEAQPAHQGPLL